MIVTLGNHEAEFLARPGKKKKAEEFEKKNWPAGVVKSLSAGRNDYGHPARPARGRARELVVLRSRKLRQDEPLDRSAAPASAVVDSRSVRRDLPARSAQVVEGGHGRKGPRGPAAAHIVFGHDPGAFKDKGTIQTQAAALLIDVGMTRVQTAKGRFSCIDHKDGRTWRRRYERTSTPARGLARAEKRRTAREFPPHPRFRPHPGHGRSPHRWVARRSRAGDLGLDSIWQHGVRHLRSCAHSRSGRGLRLMKRCGRRMRARNMRSAAAPACRGRRPRPERAGVLAAVRLQPPRLGRRLAGVPGIHAPCFDTVCSRDHVERGIPPRGHARVALTDIVHPQGVHPTGDGDALAMLR